MMLSLLQSSIVPGPGAWVCKCVWGDGIKWPHEECSGASFTFERSCFSSPVGQMQFCRSWWMHLSQGFQDSKRWCAGSFLQHFLSLARNWDSRWLPHVPGGQTAIWFDALGNGHLWISKPGQWCELKVTNWPCMAEKSWFKILSMISCCCFIITWVTWFEYSHSDEVTKIKADSTWSYIAESSFNCLPRT